MNYKYINGEFVELTDEEKEFYIPIPQPTLEEKVQLQEDKISILENENLLLKESLKLVLAGDMYSLAKVLYPEDFEGVCELK